MGGTIARLADQGHNLLLLDVTDGSPTPRGERSSRLPEAMAALAALQPSTESRGHGAGGGGGCGAIIRRALLNLPNRTVEHTIAARHAMASIIRAHQAQVIFTPQWEDAHPDHLAVTRIVEDARFDAKLTRVQMPNPPEQPAEYANQPSLTLGPPIYPRWLFYYDVSHLRRVAKPDFCIDTTGFESHKLNAIRAYRSQFGPWDEPNANDPSPPVPTSPLLTGRAPQTPFAQGDPRAQADHARLVSPDFPERMLAYGAFWGSRIGTRSAEPFFTREPLGLTSLNELVL